MIPDNIESGFFIESDSEYPVESKKKTKNIPTCRYQTKTDQVFFAPYMINVKQPNYKSTNK